MSRIFSLVIYFYFLSLCAITIVLFFQQFLATGLVTARDMEELLTSLQKFGAKKKQRGVLKDFISGSMISKIHNRDVLAQQGSDLVSSKPKIQTHDDGRPKLVSPEFVPIHIKSSYLLFR